MNCLKQTIKFELGLLDPSCVSRGPKQSKWYPFEDRNLTFDEWKNLHSYASSIKSQFHVWTFNIDSMEITSDLAEIANIDDQISLDDLQFCHGALCIDGEFAWIFSQFELFLLSASSECAKAVFGCPVEDLFESSSGMFRDPTSLSSDQLATFFKVRSMVERANRE